MLFVKTLNLLKHVTVEPAICLYFMATTMTAMCGLNLMLQKSCHPDIKPGVSDKCPDEISAQKNIAFINTWSKLVHFSLPVIFVVFAGAWSDNNGMRRRPLILLPIAGQILADLLSIVNVYFWTWSPVVAALTDGIVSGLTGARDGLILGASCYITDITTIEDRTFRLGLGVVLFFVCKPIGAALGGIIYTKFGFYVVFLATILMNTAAICFVFLFVKNTHLNVENIKRNKQNFFDPNLILQCLSEIIRRRDGYNRTVLLLIVIAMPLIEGALLGEYSVLYLFVRYVFDWDLQMYGFYAAYKMGIILVGTVISLGLLSRFLRFSDAMIGIIASITQITSNVGNAFATHPYEMYIYPIIDFMHGSSMAVSFSIASKTVDPTEIGRVNGAISALKALMPLIIVPIYNFVYNKTLSFFPGCFFLISASIGTTLLILFSVMFILQRIDMSRPTVVEECTKL